MNVKWIYCVYIAQSIYPFLQMCQSLVFFNIIHIFLYINTTCEWQDLCSYATYLYENVVKSKPLRRLPMCTSCITNIAVNVSHNNFNTDFCTVMCHQRLIYYFSHGRSVNDYRSVAESRFSTFSCMNADLNVFKLCLHFCIISLAFVFVLTKLRTPTEMWSQRRRAKNCSSSVL